jgi:hypothetical protein
LSLAQFAKAYKISCASVARALKQSEGALPKIPLPDACADAGLAREAPWTESEPPATLA